MHQFKEIVFFKIRREQQKQQRSHDRSQKRKIPQLRQQLKSLLKWSYHSQRYELKQRLANYENKAIYNSGVVIREENPDHYVTELITTVPGLICFATEEENDFHGLKNFINYTCQVNTFRTDPFALFETLGYKEMDVFEDRQIQYFRSLSMGLEVFIYPKSGYIQMVQTSTVELNPVISAIRMVLKQIREHIDAKQNVNVSIGIMRPSDID